MYFRLKLYLAWPKIYLNVGLGFFLHICFGALLCMVVSGVLIACSKLAPANT
jgi:hypothetical protein